MPHSENMASSSKPPIARQSVGRRNFLKRTDGGAAVLAAGIKPARAQQPQPPTQQLTAWSPTEN